MNSNSFGVSKPSEFHEIGHVEKAIVEQSRSFSSAPYMQPAPFLNESRSIETASIIPASVGNLTHFQELPKPTSTHSYFSSNGHPNDGLTGDPNMQRFYQSMHDVNIQQYATARPLMIHNPIAFSSNQTSNTPFSTEPRWSSTTSVPAAANYRNDLYINSQDISWTPSISSSSHQHRNFMNDLY